MYVTGKRFNSELTTIIFLSRLANSAQEACSMYVVDDGINLIQYMCTKEILHHIEMLQVNFDNKGLQRARPEII